MGKLLKVEFEDFGWQAVLGIFDGYLKDIDSVIRRLEREPEGIAKEGAINGWEMTRKQVVRYRREIERQLADQGCQV